MRTALLIILIFTLSNKGIGQTEGDFEQTGKNLFEQLVAPQQGIYVPLIRVNQYRELIERQDWSEEKKIKRINQIDQSYSILYPQWQESIRKLQREYAQALEDGAELKYLNTRHFPVSGLNKTYDLETSFIFRTATMQSEVVLRYQVGWVPEFGFHLMSIVEEGF
jgi:hypothetical protein